MSRAPVAIFTYNRLEHLKRVIAALQDNTLASETDVFLISDGASKQEDEKIIEELRSFCRTISGFKSVNFVFRNANLGAFKSITLAEQEILRMHGKIICLEDDIVTAKNFLEFMNQALDFYKANEKVISISGYAHPLNHDHNNDYWVSPHHCPWGYATWSEKWKKLDYDRNIYPLIKRDKALRRKIVFNGDFFIPTLRADFKKKIIAADARICAQMVAMGVYSIMPTKSKVLNIGNDGSGMNSLDTDQFFSEMDTGDKLKFEFGNEVEIDRELLEKYKKFMMEPVISRLKRYFLRLFKKR